MVSAELSKLRWALSAADLIRWLNPKIRGWSNYHRHVVRKRVFSRVDNAIFIRLWQWARRRNPNKSRRWLKRKYFEQHGGRSWVFFGESCDNEGKPHTVRLLLASSTPIQRHVKVESAANPYDPVDEPPTSRLPRRVLSCVQHQDHPDHGLAHSLLRSSCVGWFHRCR
jgi:RNA-directed DNA polymerase